MQINIPPSYGVRSAELDSLSLRMNCPVQGKKIVFNSSNTRELSKLPGITTVYFDQGEVCRIGYVLLDSVDGDLDGIAVDGEDGVHAIHTPHFRSLTITPSDEISMANRHAEFDASGYFGRARAGFLMGLMIEGIRITLNEQDRMSCVDISEV